MGLPVLIIGKSGSGKSASLRNFKKDIGIINVLGKPLPFKNTLPGIKTDDYKMVKSVIAKSNANTIVIDDAGYLMTNQFMRGHSSTGAGNAIFSFYNELGDSFWKLINFVVNEVPEEKIVYFIMHEDKNDFGEVKPKSIGKMLDEKVCIEGLFSIVLRAFKEEDKYYFSTQSSGYDVAKTPMGMFEEKNIENDLLEVDKTIREYYNLNNKKIEVKDNENKKEND